MKQISDSELALKNEQLKIKRVFFYMHINCNFIVFFNADSKSY